MRTRFVVFLSLLVVSLPAVRTARAEEIHRDFHERFGVTKDMRLALVHGDGDVIVSPWDMDSLDVEVRYHAKFTRVGVGPAADFQLVTDRDDRGVRVTGKETGMEGFFVGIGSSSHQEYVYRIHAPRWLALDLDGEDGEVSVEGWRSNIILRLEDGDVTIGDLEGELEIHGEDGKIRIDGSKIVRGEIDMEDGDVRVRDSSGEFSITTEDGGVDLGNVPAGTFDVRTEDGDVEMDLLPGRHLSLRVETQDGGVRIALDKEISTTYRLRTRGGDITLDVPGDHRDDDEEAVGSLGAGDGTLHVRTDDGHIVLRQNR